jgi:hypothetical protein
MRISHRGAACWAALSMAVVTSATVPTAASASPLPKLLSTTNGNNIGLFKVRPRDVIVDSADGGELVIHWQRWTGRTASGTGRAYPDHGSYPIKVQASRPLGGGYTPRVFTRLTITGELDGRWHRDPMGLGYLSGYSLAWIGLSWMNNPASGSVPWTP